MKKLFCIFLFLFPLIALTQQHWYKDSPMNFAWKYVGLKGFSGYTTCTSLAFNPSNNQPYLACTPGYASVMTFNGDYWEYVGDQGFSTSEGYISLAFNPSNNQPYVAFSDANSKARVMKFDGTNWVNVGNADFASGPECLAFNPSNNQPYVAIVDGTMGNKATVMTFNGSNWVNVGNAGFSAGNVDWESLAFSPSNNQPYIAYVDSSDVVNKVTVMTFNGTNWVNVGNADSLQGNTYCPSLAFNPANSQPYIAYVDMNNNGIATVKKFNGVNWEKVGNTDFSWGQSWGTSLAFSPIDSQPYVAFADYNSEASVMRFDGTNWGYLGNKEFSNSMLRWITLTFSPSDGEPYVSYPDVYNDNRATVMKYDSVMVGIHYLKGSNFSLYPNPATDKVRIEIAEDQIPSQLSIMNLNGEESLTLSLLKPKTQIDISNLPSGVYFVCVTNDKRVEVGKLVKQ